MSIDARDHQRIESEMRFLSRDFAYNRISSDKMKRNLLYIWSSEGTWQDHERISNNIAFHLINEIMEVSGINIRSVVYSTS